MWELGIPAKPASPRCAECRLAFPVPEWRCAECGAILHQACLASHDEVCQDTEPLRCGTAGPTPERWIRGSVACHFCGMRYSWTNVADCEVCCKMFCHGVSGACGYREPQSQRNWACVGLPEPEDQVEVAPTPLPPRLRRPPSSHESRRPPSSHGSSCICDDCLDYRDDRDYELGGLDGGLSDDGSTPFEDGAAGQLNPGPADVGPSHEHEVFGTSPDDPQPTAPPKGPKGAAKAAAAAAKAADTA